MFKVYTDGSCSPNSGPGGAGAIIIKDDIPIISLMHKGGHTTNNRMELYAVIMAFPHLPKDANVILYTDSQYVYKGITEWIFGWSKRNWVSSTGKPVKNVDLWKTLLTLKMEYPLVSFKWIKAHQSLLKVNDRSTDWEWNELADQLANSGRKIV